MKKVLRQFADTRQYFHRHHILYCFFLVILWFSTSLQVIFFFSFFLKDLQESCKFFLLSLNTELFQDQPLQSESARGCMWSVEHTFPWNIVSFRIRAKKHNASVTVVTADKSSRRLRLLPVGRSKLVLDSSRLSEGLAFFLPGRQPSALSDLQLPRK